MYNSLYIIFLNDTATTEIYTLSLHDALPIYLVPKTDEPEDLPGDHPRPDHVHDRRAGVLRHAMVEGDRSEEHTSELQSRQYLICRLLLEKNKYTSQNQINKKL